MRILYDDRELVAQLLEDKKRLIAENDRLNAQSKLLMDRLGAIETAILKLATDKLKAPVQLPQTPESIARQLGIPEHLVSQIDFARLGMQVQDELSGQRR